MKTLLYPEFDRLEIADQPVPDPAPGEVRIRMEACGICGSELEAFKNRSPRRRPPLVMGHEFCGVREDTGERVVSNALVPCGKCNRCRRGRPHLCADRQIFGMNRLGAFAEFVNVPESCLIPWPDSLPAESACLAEPLANGIHMERLTRAWQAETVLVLGAGPIGLMAQQVFQTVAGASVFVADLSSARIAVANSVGAKRGIDAREEDTVAVCRELTGGEGVDVVIDAAGSAATKQQSIAALRPGGAAVWIGLHADEATFNTYEITLPEKAVLGTYAATMEELGIALELMTDSDIDVTSWIDTFPLDRGVEAFQRMLAAEGSDIKAVLTP